jgi:hypothetical protein
MEGLFNRDSCLILRAFDERAVFLNLGCLMEGLFNRDSCLTLRAFEETAVWCVMEGLFGV